jgi:hypothetical protein
MAMNKFAVLALLACELAVGGCGSTRTSTSNAQAVTSGLWGAVLAGGSGDASGAVLGFIIDFTVNSNGTLNITEFSFNTNPAGTNNPACFVSETESGTSSLTTTTGNEIEGSINFVVTSSSPTGNTLTLNGTEVGNSITGTWTLVGSDFVQGQTSNCNSSGTFTMTKS